MKDGFRRRQFLSGSAAVASMFVSNCVLAGEVTGGRISRPATGGSQRSLTNDSFEDGDMCVATDAATEGPYYSDKMLERTDIRDGKEGMVLDLELKVVETPTCAPLGRVMVDIWHCDALGQYSRFNADPQVRLSTGERISETGTERWLRGRQQTDGNGQVVFRTIYPGWYSGRTHHIHGKVWVAVDRAFTFQMYFPDSLNRDVALRFPYSQRPSSSVTNDRDFVIARSGGGRGSFMKVSRNGDGFKGMLVVGAPMS